MKATFAEINGEGVMLMKDPKTDSSKKSQRGMVSVLETTDGIIMVDGIVGNTLKDKELLENSLLEVVYKDGKLLQKQTLSDIRDILSK